MLYRQVATQGEPPVGYTMLTMLQERINQATLIKHRASTTGVVTIVNSNPCVLPRIQHPLRRKTLGLQKGDREPLANAIRPELCKRASEVMFSIKHSYALP